MSLVQKTIFIGIILLAVLLRVIHLDENPPHLGNDEISIAYDAYSVSKTFRDEHNNFMPLSFRSHNTYKAPLTIYLVAVTTKMFGNNEYSVRLPSAIFGVLTIIVLGLLVKELTRNSSLALISIFILTISPWHIYTSRIIYESNIALFFITTGIFLFYRWVSTASYFYIILSFIAFALSMYGYHTEWIFTPFLIFILIILYRDKLRNSNIFWLSFCFFIILILPLIFDYFNNLHTNARANTELIYQNPAVYKVLHDNNFSFLQKLALLLKTFLGNYSSYINLGGLFFNGTSIPFHDAPLRLGLFPWILLPCFFVDLVGFKKLFGENTKFLIIWTITSPIIPALTIGETNIVRNLTSIIPYVIVLSTGSFLIWNNIHNKWVKICVIGLSIIFAFQLVQFYYRFYPVYSAEGFQYGYKQIARFINKQKVEYSKIIIDPKFGDDHNFDGLPHLYIPYYTNYDPQTFLNQRRDLLSGLYFGKYEIRKVEWDIQELNSDILYITPVSNSPQGSRSADLKLLDEISLPNGHPAFRIYQKR